MNQQQIEDRIGQALSFLSDTDNEHADLLYEARKAEAKYKAAVDAHFLAAEGSIEQRKAEARQACEPLYIEYLEAQREADKVRNKRDHEVHVIDWLRTLTVNRRTGG